MNTKVLAPEHLACFEKQGYVHIREAFRRANALAMQEFMWSRLKALHNIERSDRSTWSDNTNGLNKSAKASVYSGIGSHRLCSTINQLLGPGAWQVPKSWGGFLITFPQGSRDSWELTRKNWHWDGKPSDHFKALNGLFILMLFSHIEPRGGGTLLLSGSHQLISRFVEAGRQKQKPINLNRFRLSHPWIAELAGMKSRIKDRNERLQYLHAEGYGGRWSVGTGHRSDRRAGRRLSMPSVNISCCFLQPLGRTAFHARQENSKTRHGLIKG